MHERAERTVVFSGGGTGGHLYPALALADALRALHPEVRAQFVGARRGLEARVLPDRNEEHLLLPVEGFARGAPIWRHVGALLPLARGLARVLSFLRQHDPEVVVVTGGYAGAPAGLGAILLRIPLVLQEQNAEPGLVTRILSRGARQVHVAFPEAGERLPRRARKRVRVSGNPVSPPPADPAFRARARERLKLSPEGIVVLVVGGSQGSAPVNRAVEDAVVGVAERRLHRPEGLQLLWSTGPEHLEGVRNRLAGRGRDWVHLTGYIEDMPSALAASDVAVSRAGAMATAEFLAWGLPSILVPLPGSAADHQARNAAALEAAEAAVHLPQEGLEAGDLWREILGLVSNAGARESMARAARARGRPGASEEIARAIASLLPGSEPAAPPESGPPSNSEEGHR